MVEESKTNRKEYYLRVGPLLKKIFEKQREIVNKTTWDCINSSDWEIGEIIAKKIIESKLIL